MKPLRDPEKFPLTWTGFKESPSQFPIKAWEGQFLWKTTYMIVSGMHGEPGGPRPGTPGVTYWFQNVSFRDADLARFDRRKFISEKLANGLYGVSRMINRILFSAQPLDYDGCPVETGTIETGLEFPRHVTIHPETLVFEPYNQNNGWDIERLVNEAAAVLGYE